MKEIDESKHGKIMYDKKTGDIEVYIQDTPLSAADYMNLDYDCEIKYTESNGVITINTKTKSIYDYEINTIKSRLNKLMEHQKVAYTKIHIAGNQINLNLYLGWRTKK